MVWLAVFLQLSAAGLIMLSGYYIYQSRKSLRAAKELLEEAEKRMQESARLRANAAATMITRG